MSIVIDASLAVAWLFDDECTPAVDAVLADVAARGAQVPGLWRLEVANALLMAVRRKRIDYAFRNQALQRLAALLPLRGIAEESDASYLARDATAVASAAAALQHVRGLV